ncbi:MAG: hydroxymyristoyl-ACP dehydratase [Bacteroidales bacterium]|jgi:3-hydroxyacyl-[acyl-carrier-protein] dehydratase|nr:hydroxymyristoyl-ACP dehydratase [Bacteroidales bacterium]
MKLLNSFFKIINFYSENIQYSFILELNPEHEIYKAHFPNNPITPGVCILQIVKECCAIYLFENKEIQINKIKTIKFLNPINPLENPIIFVNIQIEQNKDFCVISFVFNDGSVNKTFTKAKIQVKI